MTHTISRVTLYQSIDLPISSAFLQHHTRAYFALSRYLSKSPVPKDTLREVAYLMRRVNLPLSYHDRDVGFILAASNEQLLGTTNPALRL